MRAPSRSSVRPGSRTANTTRHVPSYASRLERLGATSPTGSVSSTNTTGTKRKDRDFESDAGVEETNINVVVRCRGRNAREIKENSNVVVRTDAVKGQLVELSMGPSALSNRTYNFDRVFSQAADQNMVFDDTVKPILDEVGWDFACTTTHLLMISDACRLQLHNLRLRPDWYWKDVHNVW